MGKYDINMIRQMVEVDGISMSSVAAQLGTAPGVVSVICKKHGIAGRHKSIEKLLPIAKVYGAYVAGASLDALHKAYCAPVARIKRQLLKYKPEMKFRSMDDAKRPSILNDREQFAELANKYSFRKIASMVGVRANTVCAVAARYGIKALHRSPQRSVDAPVKAFVIPSTGKSVKSGIKVKYCNYEYYIEPDGISIAHEPGPNRRVVVRDMLVAAANSADLGKFGDYYKIVIQDADRYYCCNWKLIWNTPGSCADWLLNYGFMPPQYPSHILRGGLDGYKSPGGAQFNANFQNDSAVSLIKHFSQHYWRSTHKGYLPVTAAWECGNTSILRNAIERAWAIKSEVAIYGFISSIIKFYKDFAAVSIFKPWVARGVYDKYLPSGGVIVDPCMGWGGRLLGTIDAKYQYLGSDLNQNVIDSHVNLRKFVGARFLSEPQFSVADATVCDFPDGDLLLTSPPYDDTEHYFGIDSSKTLTKPIVENILSKFRGMVALNLPKRQEEMCLGVAAKCGRRLVDRIEMKTASFMGREKTFEPILVFATK